MNLPQRKRIRMEWYDYSAGGAYFITICTQDRIHYFWEINNGIINLNVLWTYCFTTIQELSKRRQSIDIHEFVVMPNHIHMVIVTKERNDSMTKSVYDYRRANLLGLPNNGNINENGTTKNRTLQDLPNNENINNNRVPQKYEWPTLWSIIGMMKQSISKFAITQNIPFQRQARFHDHIIRTETSYNNIISYIRNNPANRQNDKFYS